MCELIKVEVKGCHPQERTRPLYLTIPKYLVDLIQSLNLAVLQPHQLLSLRSAVLLEFLIDEGKVRLLNVFLGLHTLADL